MDKKNLMHKIKNNLQSLDELSKVVHSSKE